MMRFEWKIVILLILMRVLLNDKCELLKCNEGGNELLMWGKI